MLPLPGLLSRGGGSVVVDWHKPGANNALSDHGVGQDVTSIVHDSKVYLEEVAPVADQGNLNQ